MAIVKSKLLKQLSNNYPNFLQKDLSKFTDIILNEIKGALKRAFTRGRPRRHDERQHYGAVRHLALPRGPEWLPEVEAPFELFLKLLFKALFKAFSRLFLKFFLKSSFRLVLKLSLRSSFKALFQL